MDKKPIILKDGKLSQINAGETSINDFYSGTTIIPTGETYMIPEIRQSINFTVLTLDGTLNLEGDLWLA